MHENKASVSFMLHCIFFCFANFVEVAASAAVVHRMLQLLLLLKFSMQWTGKVPVVEAADPEYRQKKLLLSTS